MVSSTSMHVLEVCHVPPSLSISNTELSVPLTFFDLQWLKFHPVERIYYYKVHDVTKTSFMENIIPMLKESLSITLSHFLPLVGYLTWPSESPKPILHYTPGDSVSLTIAESECDLFFDTLTGDNVFQANDCRHFVPELSVSDEKASAIALQVTVFPHKGLSVGISSHHAVVDGRSSTLFMKAWAHIHKLLLEGSKGSVCLSPELTPFFDRDVIKDPSGLDVVYANSWINASIDPSSTPRSLKLWDNMEIHEDLVRATFKLSREDLSYLRNKVVSWQQKSGKEKLHLSSFVITTSYVLTCMLRAIGFKIHRRAFLVFAADFRARMDPPVPTNYVGNCVGKGGLVELEPEYFSEEDGMAIVAEKISEAIKETEKKALEEAEKWMSDIQAVAMDKGNLLIGMAGSPRFEVYKTDYGWGRPDKVEIVSADRNGAIAIAESKDGSGGVEIGIVLKKPEFEVFASEFQEGLMSSL